MYHAGPLLCLNFPFCTRQLSAFRYSTATLSFCPFRSIRPRQRVERRNITSSSCRHHFTATVMDPPPYAPFEPLSHTDFETASIRSAAPSYTSEAPPYVSAIVSTSPNNGLHSPYIYSSSTTSRYPRANITPSLAAFRMPTWSHTQISNPTARHYHSVAQRRATARIVREQATLLAVAVNGKERVALMKRKMDEQEERKTRMLEDPHLVGEQAAEENKQQRLRRFSQ
jgi:hypothetical protein